MPFALPHGQNEGVTFIALFAMLFCATRFLQDPFERAAFHKLVLVHVIKMACSHTNMIHTQCTRAHTHLPLLGLILFIKRRS